MKRRLLIAFFLAAPALNAAAQRVSLQVPLSPLPSLTVAASIAPLAQTFPLSLSPLGPSLPTATAAAQPLLHKQSPKVIDTLRAHGPDATNLSDLKGEAGAAALEANFMSAAALGDGVVTPSADAPQVESSPNTRPLMERMLEREPAPACVTVLLALLCCR